MPEQITDKLLETLLERVISDDEVVMLCNQYADHWMQKEGAPDNPEVRATYQTLFNSILLTRMHGMLLGTDIDTSKS